jgi:hypothetical protein
MKCGSNEFVHCAFIKHSFPILINKTITINPYIFIAIKSQDLTSWNLHILRPVWHLNIDMLDMQLYKIRIPDSLPQHMHRLVFHLCIRQPPPLYLLPFSWTFQLCDLNTAKYLHIFCLYFKIYFTILRCRFCLSSFVSPCKIYSLASVYFTYIR